ncbi:hypothetical protein [Psychroserpens burtonensis]|nr:hypothetical protein [Psychroserpens burtonensis]
MNNRATNIEIQADDEINEIATGSSLNDLFDYKLGEQADVVESVLNQID